MKLHYSNISNDILDVKEDKRNECFNWGVDNAYPSLVEALISMSVTASNCTDRATKAVYGAGFGDKGKIAVNSKGESLNEVLRIVAKQYEEQGNAFLHIGYNANLDINSITVIPCTEARIGKSDDRGYSGKIIDYNNWDKKKGRKIMSSKFNKRDIYNNDKAVIEGQILHDCTDGEIEDCIQSYSGQVLHVKRNPLDVYSKPRLFPAMRDALLERNSQTFRSNGAEKGFLNTKILTVQPFASDDERREFKRELNTVRGADNSSDIVVLESSQMSEDITKQMSIGDLSGTYNDKLFEYSDKQAEKNICKAFNVPLALISQTDNSLFGSSGEMLKEAKNQLWENRKEEREQLTEVFEELMSNFKKPVSGLVIQNPLQV